MPSQRNLDDLLLADLFPHSAMVGQIVNRFMTMLYCIAAFFASCYKLAKPHDIISLAMSLNRLVLIVLEICKPILTLHLLCLL